MSQDSIVAVLHPDGRIVLSGSKIGEMCAPAKAVELWQSGAAGALAVHFLMEAKPACLMWDGDPAREEGLGIDAAGFFQRAGLPLPKEPTRLQVGAVDEGRRVVALRLAAGGPGGLAAESVLDDYPALEMED